MMRYNSWQQPIGAAVENFSPATAPETLALAGQYCRLERISMSHLDDLYNVYGPASPAANWTYMNMEAFPDKPSFTVYLQQMITSSDPYHFAVIDQSSGKAVGTFALMRITLGAASMEVGFVTYGEELKRTRTATEAQYLLARYAFEELGCRRYEWKCDSLNEASRRAALRLGFTYEGTFRQALVYKGRNRDTAWFSLLDSEWPARKQALENWLAAENFDSQGQQLTPLQADQ